MLLELLPVDTPLLLRVPTTRLLTLLLREALLLRLTLPLRETLPSRVTLPLRLTLLPREALVALRTEPLLPRITPSRPRALMPRP